MSVYNDLTKYLNDNNIKFEEEEIDKNVYQFAFKMEKQINVFVYEYSHIKIFIPLGVSVNDNDAEKAVSTEGNDERTGTACNNACHRQEDASYEGRRIA